MLFEPDVSIQHPHSAEVILAPPDMCANFIVTSDTGLDVPRFEFAGASVEWLLAALDNLIGGSL